MGEIPKDLSGANLTWDIKAWMTADPAGPTHHGAAFLAFNVGAMQNLDSFKERVDGLIDQIHDTPTADGVDQLFVAGEFEWNRYQKSVDSGIDLPADVIAALNDKGLKDRSVAMATATPPTTGIKAA